MYRRSLLLLFAGFLASCAKKKRITVVRPPAPPARSTDIVSPENGIASWYGHPYHGRPAANGEIYDMEKLTAAHRTLAFETWVRVTNVANQKFVDVRITDRGPFIDGRIIDLSHAAAREIDLIGPGVGAVRIDVLSVPPAATFNSLFAVQVGAFREKPRAEMLRASLEQQYGSARIVERDGNPPFWRVLAGREHSEDAARALADRISSEIGPAFVVRLDPKL